MSAEPLRVLLVEDDAALIAAADQSLYAGKRGGRNRAIRYCDLSEQPETS